MVKLEQAALHPVVALKLQECEAFALFGVALLGDDPDGDGLDGGKVFFYGGFRGCEREVSYDCVFVCWLPFMCVCVCGCEGVFSFARTYLRRR